MKLPTPKQEDRFFDWPEDEPMTEQVHEPITTALMAMGLEYSGEGEWYYLEDWIFSCSLGDKGRWRLESSWGKGEVFFDSIPEFAIFIGQVEPE